MGLARTFEAAAKPAQKPARDVLSALLALGRPLVMGILNVTPDSFSDGGKFIDPAMAIAHAGEMAKQGADILDIGAESTRPYGGMKPISADEEMARLAPVLPAAVKLGLPVSIDTNKANVATWALGQGASIVNDVWGLQRDPGMAPLIAERGVPVIVMANRESADASLDIIAEVSAFFARSLEIAERAGIAATKIVLDPGIGFGKSAAQNFELLQKLPELARLGFPLLVGASRKGFIGKALGGLPEGERAWGTAAAVAASILGGAHIVRVHDVAEMSQAVRVIDGVLRPASVEAGAVRSGTK